jgi:hypothetical protein
VKSSLILLCLLLAVACGGSGGTSVQRKETKGLLGTFNILNSSMNTFGSIVPERETSSFLGLHNESYPPYLSIKSAAFNDIWDTIELNDETQDGSYNAISLAEWIQIQLDPKSTRGGYTDFSPVGPLGRFKKSMEGFCIIGVIFPASGLDQNKNPIPRDEPYKFTLTAAERARVDRLCDFDEDDNQDDISFSVEVSAVTPNDVYDLKLKITVDGSDRDPDINYMKNDDNYITFASLEYDTKDDGKHYGYRVTVQYDKNNRITRMEYATLEFTAIDDDNASAIGDSTNNLFRIFMDERRNQGYIYQSEGSLLSGDHGMIRKVVSGLPTTGRRPFNLSFIAGDTYGGTTDKEYRACVTHDMKLQRDGSFCNALGVSGLELTSQPNVNTTLANSKWGKYSSIRMDRHMDFDASNLLSTPFVQLIE